MGKMGNTYAWQIELFPIKDGKPDGWRLDIWDERDGTHSWSDLRLAERCIAAVKLNGPHLIEILPDKLLLNKLEIYAIAKAPRAVAIQSFDFDVKSLRFSREIGTNKHGDPSELCRLGVDFCFNDRNIPCNFYTWGNEVWLRVEDVEGLEVTVGRFHCPVEKTTGGYKACLTTPEMRELGSREEEK